MDALRDSLLAAKLNAIVKELGRGWRAPADAPPVHSVVEHTKIPARIKVQLLAQTPPDLLADGQVSVHARNQKVDGDPIFRARQPAVKGQDSFDLCPSRCQKAMQRVNSLMAVDDAHVSFFNN